MADLNKVIAGLEACLRSTPKYCFGCPYEGAEYCHDEMFTDALELLRSIPHTCEECKNWTDRNSVGSPCWECIRKGDEPPTKWRWKHGNN